MDSSIEEFLVLSWPKAAKFDLGRKRKVINFENSHYSKEYILDGQFSSLHSCSQSLVWELPSPPSSMSFLFSLSFICGFPLSSSPCWPLAFCFCCVTWCRHFLLKMKINMHGFIRRCFNWTKHFFQVRIIDWLEPNDPVFWQEARWLCSHVHIPTLLCIPGLYVYKQSLLGPYIFVVIAHAIFLVIFT